MHSAIHLPLADASARARIEPRGASRGPLAALRSRMASRAGAAAPGVPVRAAPGTDARAFGHP